VRIELKRFYETDDATIGFIGVNGTVMLFSLEDEGREEKVMHETRIPAGIYRIGLKSSGGFSKRYKERFNFHVGMLELQGVPGFTDILIHCGNTDDDTSGCVLVGMQADLDTDRILKSTKAYEILYKMVIEAMNNGEEVSISIYDRM